MTIPWQELENETLINIIQSFVLREGTDYGDIEKSLQEKVDDILTQLKQKKIVLVWSELHETIDIKSSTEFC